MGAKGRAKSLIADESGQSLLEFVFMLPILIGFAYMLVRSNSVMQTSIVNQQYARAQALFIAQNSPYYPRIDQTLHMVQHKSNQLIIGVSDEASPEDEDGNAAATTDILPVAPKRFIGRSRSQRGARDALETEPSRQAYPRVRTTVSLCTYSNVIQGAGGAWVPNLSVNLPEVQSASVFQYCRSGKTGMEPN